jgi:hypothetical protein
MEVVELSCDREYRAADLFEACGAISGTVYPHGDHVLHGMEDIEYLREVAAELNNGDTLIDVGLNEQFDTILCSEDMNESSVDYQLYGEDLPF